jgi:hypothetical protein
MKRASNYLSTEMAFCRQIRRDIVRFSGLTEDDLDIASLDLDRAYNAWRESCGSAYKADGFKEFSDLLNKRPCPLNLNRRSPLIGLTQTQVSLVYAYGQIELALAAIRVEAPEDYCDNYDDMERYSTYALVTLSSAKRMLGPRTVVLTLVTI